MRWHVLQFPWCVIALLACGDAGSAPPPFPSDYAERFVEVRDCRRSGDHDLNYIRILTNPESAAIYVDRDQPFAKGAVILKEEYDFSDGDCSGDISQWTVMFREESNADDEMLGWTWLQVDADRQIKSENLPRCYGCHSLCVNGMGHDATCADP